MAANTKRGCPRGALSIQLWPQVADYMLLNRNGVVVQGYAENIVILVRRKNKETVMDIFQQTQAQGKGWCAVEQTLKKLL